MFGEILLKACEKSRAHRGKKLQHLTIRLDLNFLFGLYLLCPTQTGGKASVAGSVFL